ncbi:response regulator containing a CheY-like receiver domain and an HTH DNA-binding domain [Aequorivita sublithincola DSM 14238]|uniref:Response regulator containing a CheY-like receiver domain and an HTH DNA-binding domain n=1 Tax=Aequorivita sublithincola (strain DSM 14238 / LMG 21431 / ACAM 643 / 9-3) TaxID=746697 RepID=I3YYF6_AEQSU|nr:response regulator transcription factor [Aequorivita sublithincola]AFL82024.1 response regulator containing a CheY-like receiver domain and an HTH DNA-binding domain [Aequorivita sublithincola DSM 14238]
MSIEKRHTVAIVDDHALFAGSLEKLINTFSDFNVLFLARNGKELKERIKVGEAVPDIILLDINMPIMNGFETADWLSKNYPKIKILALSMEDDEHTVLKIVRKGAKGYLLKDIHPEILNTALKEVVDKGYYHSEKVSEVLLHAMGPDEERELLQFKDNEMTFIELACSEMTYKEIADIMHLSPKTIDGYRQDLFKRLKIKNRVGLVIFALKKNLIKL